MKPGRWRHMLCSDMDLDITQCYRLESGDLLCRVNYLSRTGAYRFNDRPDTVTIKANKLHMWAYIGE